MLTKQEQKIILKIIPTLNEPQTRWFLAKEALSLGHGGMQYLHELTGISRPTIAKGKREIISEKSLPLFNERLRSPGGGRKSIENNQPNVEKALKKIMNETTAGDPMSELRWTCKSTYKISEELRKQGYEISQRSVHRKLIDMDYSLQLNTKHKEGNGSDHPNRDRQF